MSETPDPSHAPQDRIVVAVDGDTGYVRVEGRGSFKVSATVKDFCRRVQEQDGKHLVVNLEKCVGMDSTFMGVLAGISQKLKKEGGSLRMTHVSEKLKGLMTTLGLIRLVTVVEDPEPAPEATEELKATPQGALASAQEMLEAHETLVDIQEDNKLRFQDVLDYLREDIQRQRST